MVFTAVCVHVYTHIYIHTRSVCVYIHGSFQGPGPEGRCGRRGDDRAQTTPCCSGQPHQRTGKPQLRPGNRVLLRSVRVSSAPKARHTPRSHGRAGGEAPPRRAASLTARWPLRPPRGRAAPGAEHAGTCSHRAPVAAERLGACADPARLCKVAASGWARTGCHLGRGTEELLRRRAR